MKEGDVVNSVYGKRVKIVEIKTQADYDFFTKGEQWALCEDLTGSLPQMWYKLSELHKFQVCECGSAHTVNKNCHMFYCPMNKRN